MASSGPGRRPESAKDLVPTGCRRLERSWRPSCRSAQGAGDRGRETEAALMPGSISAPCCPHPAEQCRPSGGGGRQRSDRHAWISSSARLSGEPQPTQISSRLNQVPAALNAIDFDQTVHLRRPDSRKAASSDKSGTRLNHCRSPEFSTEGSSGDKDRTSSLLRVRRPHGLRASRPQAPGQPRTRTNAIWHTFQTDTHPA